MLTRKPSFSFLLMAIITTSLANPGIAQVSKSVSKAPVFGYTDFSSEAKIEDKFLAVPNAKLAGEHLKTLTAEPHIASTPEDRKTAEYVAQKFRAAGLETEIVPYRVLLNQPKVVRVEAFDAAGKSLMNGPTPEHVQGDSLADNPGIVMPFNGSSGSGDVTGDLVYANYGRLEDFDQLAAQHVDLHGKIVIVRYGANFRGVKVYIAEQRGAIGVLIYSDPQDDGYYKGDAWPIGPWRPETGVQRGSVQFLFKYPGDPQTPGVASTPDLPDSARVSGSDNQPHIISIPLSYHDAAPLLQALKGPSVPQGWQGALPFRYHIGASGVRVHLVSQQDYQVRTIWDVIGKIKGSEYPDEWVVVGNHRDAWVYGAVDPNSGTASMLESVHGIGALIHDGWRPKRTIIFGSWDAEEEGLIGSTEWVEQHAQALDHAVAYFNVDVAVSGPDFTAAAVPSLKQFMREIAKSVPSPVGDTVYQEWHANRHSENEHRASNAPAVPGEEVRVSDLGSGSDFTPFLQHAGVPSTDIGSGGPYGVYHSAFDNYAGTSRTPIRTSHTCSKWHACSASKRCEWPTPTSCPTTMWPTRERFAPTSNPPNAKPPMPACRPRILTLLRQQPPASPLPQIAFAASNPQPTAIQLNSILSCVRLKRTFSPPMACPTVPGTSTPSMPRASSPDTLPSSFPA